MDVHHHTAELFWVFRKDAELGTLAAPGEGPFRTEEQALAVAAELHRKDDVVRYVVPWIITGVSTPDPPIDLGSVKVPPMTNPYRLLMREAFAAGALHLMPPDENATYGHIQSDGRIVARRNRERGLPLCMLTPADHYGPCSPAAAAPGADLIRVHQAEPVPILMDLPTATLIIRMKAAMMEEGIGPSTREGLCTSSSNWNDDPEVVAVLSRACEVAGHLFSTDYLYDCRFTDEDGRPL